MEKLKVLILDNSVFYKKILTQVVESTGLGIVTNTASSGALAIERLSQGSTDVVLLDMFTPEAKLLETLEEIRRRYPYIFLIMLVSPGSDSQAEKFRSPEAGVMDFIKKPPAATADKNIGSIKQRMQGLFTQIIARKFTSRNVNTAPSIQQNITPPPAAPAAKKRRLSGVDLVLIASSTGGPAALETVLKNLPAGFDKPVLVVQHMPAELTGRMAQSLDKKCSLPVLEAQDGGAVRPGQIMIAPGGFHMTVETGKGPGVFIKVESTPPVNGVKPAADVLFRSVARAYRDKRVLAVILTGMGSDGMLGVEEIKKSCECFCLAQSERTCVVYGMPKSVVDAGLSDAVEDLATIPFRILQIVSGRG